MKFVSKHVVVLFQLQKSLEIAAKRIVAASQGNGTAFYVAAAALGALSATSTDVTSVDWAEINFSWPGFFSSTWYYPRNITEPGDIAAWIETNHVTCPALTPDVAAGEDATTFAGSASVDLDKMFQFHMTYLQRSAPSSTVFTIRDDTVALAAAVVICATAAEIILTASTCILLRWPCLWQSRFGYGCVTLTGLIIFQLVTGVAKEVAPVYGRPTQTKVAGFDCPSFATFEAPVVYFRFGLQFCEIAFLSRLWKPDGHDPGSIFSLNTFVHLALHAMSLWVCFRLGPGVFAAVCGGTYCWA